jgi:death-on-curing protein
VPERTYLTVAEVIAIHEQLIGEYGGVHGIRDRGLLESAVFRHQMGYYSRAAEEAAALMESLANNHPFLDGNKRTAFAAAHTFLLINGFDLEVNSRAACDFIIRSIAEGEFYFARILEWIDSHMVET